MNADKPSTKEKIIDLAEKLFQTQGYNGFSYNDISSVLGIKNAAIHYYFPTKEALGAAIISRAHDRFIEWQKHQDENYDCWQRLENFIQMYYSANLKDSNRICLVTSCAVVFHTLPEQIKTEVTRYSEEILKWISSLLGEGKKTGVFCFKGEPSDKAAVLISSLSASLQIARIRGKEFYMAVWQQVINELKP